jgi:hypothetical protein
VIPDIVQAGAEEQDYLISQWPHGDKGAPVWHMHEPTDRLLLLSDNWPRVCIGSSAQYATVLSDGWQRRMDDTWDLLSRYHTRTPWVHMLRGMQLVRHRWPFASVDSTDVARNHNGIKCPKKMAERWDAGQCPSQFIKIDKQMEMFDA